MANKRNQVGIKWINSVWSGQVQLENPNLNPTGLLIGLADPKLQQTRRININCQAI